MQEIYLSTNHVVYRVSIFPADFLCVSANHADG